ncbi:hypothetical protein BST43_00450 [Mycobacteroides saopaulense]|uniref:Uncharacterized protein n=1 Tax=Mycobacteroides saopaulense TaxID=1578165 RepID=A0A1X0JE30_9MYCO|nr:hypothetical protein BST43_00450 [Mycobacteroides saopaulense]
MAVVDAGPGDDSTVGFCDPPHATADSAMTPTTTCSTGLGQRFGDMVDHVIRNGYGDGVV